MARETWHTTMKGVGVGGLEGLTGGAERMIYNNLYKQEVATPLCPSVAQNPVER